MLAIIHDGDQHRATSAGSSDVGSRANVPVISPPPAEGSRPDVDSVREESNARLQIQDLLATRDGRSQLFSTIFNSFQQTETTTLNQVAPLISELPTARLSPPHATFEQGKALIGPT